MNKSRKYSVRVQQKVVKDPVSFRKNLWKISGVGSLVILLGIFILAALGQRDIYEAGPVTQAHRFIENDCAQCHVTWSPLTRLLTWNGQVSSVTEAKCQQCHLGLPHHPLPNSSTATAESSVPGPHGSLSCAACHREHQGERSLIEFANQECINCHQELDKHGGSTQFVKNIGNFGDSNAPDAHPAFALHRLLKSETANPVSNAAKKLLLPSDDLTAIKPNLQSTRGDVSQMRFNHQLHLKQPVKDAMGNIVDGLKDANGKIVDLSQNCSFCHQPDAQFGRMQLVNYESHCKDCHPLSVGLDRIATNGDPPALAMQKISIPHEEISTVVGFLTHEFTLKALEGKTFTEPKPLPGRLLPGVTYQPPVDEEAARKIELALEQANVHVDTYLGSMVRNEAKGGCCYCHTVQREENGQFVEEKECLSRLSSLKIVPPNIPERWMPHAEFSHDSHRMMNCWDCHFHKAGEKEVQVSNSVETSDVLMPTIEICQKCHSDRAEKPASISNLNEIHSAGTQCTLCHSYHDRTLERKSGSLLMGQRNK